MREIFRPSRRRKVAGFIALVVMGATSFVSLRPSSAVASVTPSTSISGLSIFGPGASIDIPTAVYPITDQSGTFNLFAMYPDAAVGVGQPHQWSAWAPYGSTMVGIVSKIVSLFDASTQSALEIAAAQAAIWHFTSGWEPDRNGANSAEFLARFDELVSLASQNPDTENQGTHITLTSTSPMAAGSPIVVSMESDFAGEIALQASDPQVTFLAYANGACTSDVITSVDGPSAFCVLSEVPLDTVSITATGVSAGSPTAELFEHQGTSTMVGNPPLTNPTGTTVVSWSVEPTTTTGQATTTTTGQGTTTTGQATTTTGQATTTTGQATTTTGQGTTTTGQGTTTTGQATTTTGQGTTTTGQATTTTGQGTTTTGQATTTTGQGTTTTQPTENHAPFVGVACQQDGNTNFYICTATPSDPDGDDTTVQWYLNGELIVGAVDGVLDVELAPGDVVSVIATDSHGAVSTPATWSTDNERPEVAIGCVAGDDVMSFVCTATPTDPDGDTTTVQWYLNGQPIDGATSITITLDLGPDDVVSVVATDEHGATSEPASWSPDNEAPVVSLVCAETDNAGHYLYTATVNDPDGDATSIQWFINGTVVPDANGLTFTTTLNNGDVVSVIATDEIGAASAPATCDPTDEAPQLSLVCIPTGTPSQYAFTATVVDPQGDPTTIEWFLNGTALDETGTTLIATLDDGDIVSAVATDESGHSSTSVTCTPENSAPDVEIECAAGDGNEYTFTATATDPDGDPVTLDWFLNGVSTGKTATTITLTLTDGDQVSVKATDDNGASSGMVSANCVPDAEAPLLDIECGMPFVFGESTTFTAVATDPDGDDATLTYSWTLNGTKLDATGPSVNVMLAAVDVLQVTVTDEDGLTATAKPACAGRHRPEITVTCPGDLVFGQPATFTAVGTDLDGGPLTYKWSINDVIQANQTGASASLTVLSGQRIGVAVIDDSGLIGTPKKSISCTGRFPGGTTTGGTTSGTTGGTTNGSTTGNTTGGSTTGGSTTGGSTTGGSTTGGSTTGGSNGSGGSTVLGSLQTTSSIPKTGTKVLPLIGAGLALTGLGSMLLMEVSRRRRPRSALLK